MVDGTLSTEVAIYGLGGADHRKEGSEERTVLGEIDQDFIQPWTHGLMLIRQDGRRLRI